MGAQMPSCPRFVTTAVTTCPPAAEVIDWGLKMHGIPNLWKTTRGEGIKIGVLDSGVAYKHPDLVQAIVKGKSFCTNNKSGYADVYGHGTHVCGIIAARENNIGVIGVAPLSQLYIAKVLDDDGTVAIDKLCDGIAWCLDAGVDIISTSLWISQGSDQLQELINKAIDSGVIVVAAAGNGGSYDIDTVSYPAKYDRVISVGSHDACGLPDPTSAVGRRLDILAPGRSILSTYPPDIYATLSGTSMACPFVTGVVALLLASHRNDALGATPTYHSQSEVRKHLLAHAHDINAVGWDTASGFGLIDPAKTL
ncbi:S8 family peptidase [Desulfovibrio sp. DV]|uniref:S8 family peptidase n=1 Tax=Desulfovibrio sp. DV TaxID=1844708 RepID=UPI0009FB428D|nr:S8 family peptidase [Desulfovibrio sp. DV]